MIFRFAIAINIIPVSTIFSNAKAWPIFRPGFCMFMTSKKILFFNSEYHKTGFISITAGQRQFMIALFGGGAFYNIVTVLFFAYAVVRSG